MLFPSVSAVVVARKKMDQDPGTQRQLQELQDCLIQHDVVHCSDGPVSRLDFPAPCIQDTATRAASYVRGWAEMAESPYSLNCLHPVVQSFGGPDIRRTLQGHAGDWNGTAQPLHDPQLTAL